MRVRALPFAVLMCTACLALLWASVAIAEAQDLAAPAHIAFADGNVLLDREGQTQPATAGLPFLPGDRLRTSASRVEALFPDGSALDVDEFSTIDLQSPTLLRLTGGRLLLNVFGVDDPANAVRYQIDTPAGSASTDGPGEYRVALFSGPAGLEVELAVLRGSASLRTERDSLSVRAGERSLARELEAPSLPQAFNSARFDAFDRWSALRRDARMGTAQSAQYLPRDLQPYGSTFDRYGAWQYEAPYGRVWYPVVTPGWRPYYNGYWSSNYLYGWTWIGLDPWGWPTHHYGRWGHARSRWFWIPDRRWGPAWVTWAAAPGYVSWCPLGFDNRPVFALSVNIGNPWRGWVVLPRTHFGARGAYVHRYAVAQLPAKVPVVVQATAPVPPARAVARAAAAAPAADFAVPRTSGRDVAVPRGSARSGGAQADVAKDSSPAGTAQDRRVGAARRSGVAQGFSPANPANPAESGLKQPLADVPRAYRRNPGMAAAPTRETSAAPRAVDRSRSRETSPWYGQSSRWYGSANRAAPQAESTNPAAPPSAPAGGRSPAYARRPGAALASPVQDPQPQSVPAPAPRMAAPRWGTPAAGRPPRAEPSAPPASESRGPRAVPRGAPRSAPPSAAPAEAPSGQSAPRHAPSSRRPS